MDSLYDYGNILFAYLQQGYISLLDLMAVSLFCCWTDTSIVDIQIVMYIIKFDSRGNMRMP